MQMHSDILRVLMSQLGSCVNSLETCYLPNQVLKLVENLIHRHEGGGEVMVIRSPRHAFELMSVSCGSETCMLSLVGFTVHLT